MNAEFEVHILNELGISKVRKLAELFDSLLNDLNNLCEQSREFSIVKTKLEEACFFAKKSMASASKNQKSA